VYDFINRLIIITANTTQLIACLL